MTCTANCEEKEMETVIALVRCNTLLLYFCVEKKEKREEKKHCNVYEAFSFKFSSFRCGNFCLTCNRHKDKKEEQFV